MGLGRETSGRLGARSGLVVGLLALWPLTPSVSLASFELDPTDPAERGSATSLAVGLLEAPQLGAAASAPPESCQAPLPGSPQVSLPKSSQVRLPAKLRLYGFKPFGIREIDFAAVAVEVPTEIPVGVTIKRITLSYQRLGALSYTEEVYLLSARVAALGAAVEPAVRICLARNADGFRDCAYLLDIRGEARPVSGVRISARIKNLFASGLAGEGSRCPMRVAAGAGIAVSGSLGFGVEMEKETGFPICVASGAEFKATGGLVLRAGARTYPKELTFGIGLRRGPVALDVASSVNLELGATHEAGVTYFWK